MIGILMLFAFLFLTIRNKELGVVSTALMAPALSCLAWGFLDVYFILCFIDIFIYRKEIIKCIRQPFPFKSVFIIYLISRFLSTFFASTRHPYVFFTDIIEVLFVLAFWIAAMNIRKTMSIMSLVYRISLIACLYGIFTFLVNYNPYINETISEGINNVEGQEEMLRFGRMRIQSIFAYVETLGGFCVMMVSLACVFYKIPNIDKKVKKHIFIIVFLASLTCFLTSSRSQLVGMALVMLLFFMEIETKAKYWLFPLLSIVVLYFAYGYIDSLIGSFYETNVEGGSSKSMRLNQLALSIYYMLNASNVFIGNGLGYTNQFVIGTETGLAGAESAWFRCMIDQGIFGVISLGYLFIYSIKMFYKLYRPFSFIPIAYLAIKSLAVVPNMPISYIAFILILTIKLISNQYTNSEQQLNINRQDVQD